MGYAKAERHRGGFFYRARGLVLLCPLIFLCLSCDSPVLKDELAGQKDGAERMINDPTEIYSIVFCLNGGLWNDYAAPFAYRPDRPVTLPTATNIRKDGYTFFGWYDNESLSGSAISGWKEGDRLGAVKLWAKWGPGNAVLAADAAEVITALTGSAHTLTLYGNLNEEDISGISQALYDTRSQKVSLDMSACKGLAALPAYAFQCCKRLTGVILPGSVTSIGNNAFCDCINLTRVVMPETITVIDIYAFYGCKKLEEVTIPRSVTEISDYTFSGCENLKAVRIQDKVTVIRGYAFQGCKKLALVSIPNSVTSIETHVFSGCEKLTSVALPKSVKDIGGSAFEGCSSLTDISVDKNNTVYTAINGILFTRDEKTLVCYPAGKRDPFYSVPGSVTAIGDGAFSGCNGLTSVTIPGSVTVIGNWAFFSCKGLVSVTIPGSVTAIGNGAFYDCNGLISATILPSSVMTISNWVFSACKGLTSVTILPGVTKIGLGTFANCHSLMSVSIPDTVTEIASQAFASCRSLESVTIPGSVTSIDSYAFAYCNKLASLTFNAPEGWFMTRSEDDWKNKTNGTAVVLCNPVENAPMFATDYYWYKQ